MQSKPKDNQKIHAKVERLGIIGEGVAYWNKFTVFIDGALPGEDVAAEVFEVKKNYGRARLSIVENPSPHRVKPPCPFFSRCGGCQLMHLEYLQQLEMKRQRVNDAFKRIGKIFDVEVLPCLPSPASDSYRNKIQIPILPDDAGGIKMGLYARNSHDLVEVDQCLIHCPLGEEIFQKASAILKNSGLTAYDRRTGKGLLRHMIIKTAVATQQAIIILVTNGFGGERLISTAKAMLKEIPALKGVVQNINNKSDNVVLSNDFQTLAGESRIEETLCDLRFYVSPHSFFQVNPAQAEQLYTKALALAELSGHETVLDVFCGVGTLSLIFAAKAAKVTGVECVSQAIEDANENARINNIKNVDFICDHAESWIKKASPCDIAILNPPRKGCDPILLEKLAAFCPKKIIYISCDPATLARDVAYLYEKGYGIQTVQPVDMFPQTAHVECLVKLVFPNHRLPLI